MAASGGLIFGYDIGISGASPFNSPPVWFSWLGCEFRWTFLAGSSVRSLGRLSMEGSSLSSAARTRSSRGTCRFVLNLTKMLLSPIHITLC
jgi:hypothetical protein